MGPLPHKNGRFSGRNLPGLCKGGCAAAMRTFAKLLWTLVCTATFVWVRFSAGLLFAIPEHDKERLCKSSEYMNLHFKVKWMYNKYVADAPSNRDQVPDYPLYVTLSHSLSCLRSSKPIQIGVCMLMSLSIHLHGLHLDARYGQTWHLSTELRSGERTGRRLLCSTTLLLPTLLSDSQVSISLVMHGL